MRRRKILDRQARRRYKISEKRRKTKGLTKAARRMSRSEKRRRKALRRKLKRIDWSTKLFETIDWREPYGLNKKLIEL